MATKTAFYPRFYSQQGAIATQVVKVDGLTGHATGATVIDIMESPFNVDMLILEAYVCITTVDANDADLDIGFADRESGLNYGEEIGANVAHDTAGVLQLLQWTPAVTGVSPPIWKAPNSDRTATDSWIATYGNNSADSSDLVYNLILVLAKESDFNND